MGNHLGGMKYGKQAIILIMKQREIKFRAWDKKEKKWWYNVFVAEGIVWISIKGDGGMSVIVPRKDLIPVEYTGLKDKNEVEIHEGDIVKIKHLYKNREWQGVIVWNNNGWTGEGFFFSHFDEPTRLFSEGTKYLKVIGNIYENSNLIK